jgi:preprotein translocase subunit SecY
VNLLSSFVNAFRVPDLRKKILFTLAIIAIYRFGAHVPSPGIDIDATARLTSSPGGALSLVNLFSGGALTRLAVFALGIMPYITSSIIMQLLVVVIPKLEAWQKEGESGQKKITQATRYLTVVLALLQSTGFAFLFHSGQFTDARGNPVDLIPVFTLRNVSLDVISLTAGTALIMWLGELITQRGIGNGMSLLIFASIVSEFPSQGAAIGAQKGLGTLFFLGLIAIAVIVAIVFMEQGQRRIPVQYAKRVVGRRVYGGQQVYLPLKVNMAGVIPIIFASSVLYIPTLFSGPVQGGWAEDLINTLTNGRSIWYMGVYGMLVVFFAYFYTAIQFNPVDRADDMKKYGGFIPGIRPGRQTAEYLDRILSRITLPGALFIAAIALLPNVFLATQNIQNFPFGGTSILIAVGVTLETMKQIESQLTMRHYEGFLG